MTHRPTLPALALTTLAAATPLAAQSGSYDDLVALFHEWRAFERPTFIDGVPDYTAPAMARQQRELRAWKERLWAFDIDGWPVDR